MYLHFAENSQYVAKFYRSAIELNLNSLCQLYVNLRAWSQSSRFSESPARPLSVQSQSVSV